MQLSIPEGQFIKFLCEAKRATYAAKDGKALVTPVLIGAHQLEFRRGALLYRDIYYGGAFFVGQETVYFKREPIWGMSYAGGIRDGVDANQTPGIYDFLASALRAVPESAPFRGPDSHRQGDFSYKNRVLGGIARFSGVETISYQKLSIYQLHYSGGFLKN